MCSQRDVLKVTGTDFQLSVTHSNLSEEAQRDNVIMVMGNLDM